MDPNLKQKTQEKITKSENILICAPQNSSFDETAGALALFLSLTKLGKNAQIIAKNPTVGEALKLYAVDKIGENNTAISNLVVVISDAVNSVDKVTYFLEKDRLKIVIHPLAGEPPVRREQVSLENAPIKPDVIFAIGIKNINELKQIITQEQEIDSNVWIISINKGDVNQKFAQVNISSIEASSISEVVSQVIQELALPINEDISFNLYSGLSYSTENFSPLLSTPSSFQIAAWLIKFGAGRASLAKTYTPVKNEKIKNEFMFPQVPTASQSVKSKSQSQSQLDNDIPIEKVELERQSEQDWLKPPKVYKGSKSFDTEY